MSRNRRLQRAVVSAGRSNWPEEVQLPVIIHSRDAAADDHANSLKETKAYECGGVIHCYSYSPEMARRICENGILILAWAEWSHLKMQKNVVQTVPSGFRCTSYCVGNRLPVYGTGAKPGKAQRFVAV